MWGVAHGKYQASIKKYDQGQNHLRKKSLSSVSLWLKNPHLEKGSRILVQKGWTIIHQIKLVYGWCQESAKGKIKQISIGKENSETKGLWTHINMKSKEYNDYEKLKIDYQWSNDDRQFITIECNKNEKYYQKAIYAWLLSWSVTVHFLVDHPHID